MAMMLKNPQIVLISRAKLRPGPWQPRQIFDKEKLAELAESLRTEGVLTPLRVLPAPGGAEYLVVAGERRWRAAGLAGIGELPCIVIQEHVGEERLRELAILDNLHRADLRPGEEARAVAKLERLGLAQRDIAERLGKSPAWVGQRLAIAKLPDLAIEQLDSGGITREEAKALARLGDYPELVLACLEPDGKRLKERLGGHVPTGVGERLQAVRRVLEIERQRNAWAAKMRTGGHRVLDDGPGEGTKRYVKLPQGSEVSRVHQEAGLACEVWAWEYGRPVRYCDDRAALNKALAQAHETDPTQRARQEGHRRVLERESARDAAIRVWLATTSRAETPELAMIARERIRTLTCSDDRLLALLGSWLGETGNRSACVEAAEQALTTASDRRLVQLWFVIEIAQATSYSPVPEWLMPWLHGIGFVDPHHPVGLPSAVGTECMWE